MQGPGLGEASHGESLWVLHIPPLRIHMFGASIIFLKCESLPLPWDGSGWGRVGVA